MDRTHPNKAFVRFAGDAVVFCSSLEGALEPRDGLEGRSAEGGLELHPTKTRVVYCKDDHRRGEYPEPKPSFLRYTTSACT
jgi:RNA-directed DNA polymerase